MTLTFDRLTPNKWVSRTRRGHLFTKFGDPSCIGFRDIVWKNRQTAMKTLLTDGYRRPSQCSTVVLTLLLGRPAIPIEKGKIGDISQLRNPWADCHKIWNAWIKSGYDPACQNLMRSPQWGVPANGWSNTLAWFLLFIVFVFDKLQNVSVSPICTTKHPIRGANKHIQAYAQNIQNRISLQLQLRPNSA